MKPVFRHTNLTRFDLDFEHHKAVRAELEFALHGDQLDEWETNGAAACLERLQADYAPAFTFHGPVFGFDPASKDHAVRKLAFRRVKRAFEFAARFKPQVMVFHSSFDLYTYGYGKKEWLPNTVDFWKRALEDLPDGPRVVLENIYEIEPWLLAEAIRSVGHPRFRACFDAGHYNLFHRPDLDMGQWLLAFDGLLGHVHLHDNHGTMDEHLPPGRGLIDFSPLIDYLKTAPEPVTITVEGKNPDDNDAAVAWAKAHIPGCGE